MGYSYSPHAIFLKIYLIAKFISITLCMEDPKAFDIELNGLTCHVTDHTIKKARVFHIVYPDRRNPLNITIATNSDDEKFWTSLPEGRQEEAELAGKAIAAYLRTYRRQQACVTTIPKKSATPSLFD